MKSFCLDFQFFEDSSDLEYLPLVNIGWTFSVVFFLDDLFKLRFFY